jgi:hypothetical protein
MAAPLHAMLRRLSIVLVIHTERKGTKNPALFVVEGEKNFKNVFAVMNHRTPSGFLSFYNLSCPEKR